MSRRPGPSKKKKPVKTPKPAKNSTSTAAAKPPAKKRKPQPAKTPMYVTHAGHSVTVSDSQTADGKSRGPFTELAEVRSAALDALLGAIETTEQLLPGVRRANSLDELRKALAGYR